MNWDVLSREDALDLAAAICRRVMNPAPSLYRATGRLIVFNDGLQSVVAHLARKASRPIHRGQVLEEVIEALFEEEDVICTERAGRLKIEGPTWLIADVDAGNPEAAVEVTAAHFGLSSQFVYERTLGRPFFRTGPLIGSTGGLEEVERLGAELARLANRGPRS